MLPFVIETELEAKICADPAWVEGADWGVPRPGHAEGAVKFHVAEVLANVEREATDAEDRRRLRLIAILHDAFKYEVDESKPRTGENHHAVKARKFAERFVDDAGVLDVIELHDEAYNAWHAAHHSHKWDKAGRRIERLLARLGPNLPLFVRFYRADNATASKREEPLRWFEDFLFRRQLWPPTPTKG